MHYCNVFLVKGENKLDALAMVEKFLQPYNEALDGDMGEWDWYQWGGRWSWWDYKKEYESVLFRPQTEEEKERGSRTYWNSYHDPDVKGQKAVVTFPDGSVSHIEYGNPYPFQHWCHEHPESEIKNAIDPKFYGIIEDQLKARQKSIDRNKKYIAEYESGEDDGFNMLEYYRESLENKSKRWTIDSYFWNITDDNCSYNKEEIEKNPESWFLINCDLHS